jgi:hypothetical protein
MVKQAARSVPLSQEQIFEKVRKLLPKGSLHSSGGLPDVTGLSDVDISLVHSDPSGLSCSLPHGTIGEDRGGHYSYSIPGYDRQINLYVSSDPEDALRAVKHRRVELELKQKFPRLYELAMKARRSGLKTEPAWAHVLGLKGDPYKLLLDRSAVTAAAGRIASGKQPDKINEDGGLHSVKTGATTKEYVMDKSVITKLAEAVVPRKRRGFFDSVISGGLGGAAIGGLVGGTVGGFSPAIGSVLDSGSSTLEGAPVDPGRAVLGAGIGAGGGAAVGGALGILRYLLSRD